MIFELECLINQYIYTTQNNWRTNIFEREFNELKRLNSVKLGPNLSTLYAYKSRIIVTDPHA